MHLKYGTKKGEYAGKLRSVFSLTWRPGAQLLVLLKLNGTGFLFSFSNFFFFPVKYS